MTEQNDDSAFSQAHIRSMNIQKIAKTLPKSPRKRKEFKLRIKPTQARRPKNELSDREKEWLKNFLDKPDLTYVIPGRNDHLYVAKVDGKSQYVQKRYVDTQ